MRKSSIMETGMFIEVENIRKSYGRKATVLNGTSFHAASGEYIAIVGANGCGKSTLLEILAGSLKADGGSLKIDGNDAFKDRKMFQKYIGFVPQDNPLMEKLSVRDNLKFWYCDTGRDMETDLQSGVPAVLGVSGYLDKRVDKLSGGMKKRLSICCALAKNPPVLILDEPGASLDIVCKQDIMNYLSAYTKSGGIVLITSHEEGELKLADRMYLLKDGMLNELEHPVTGNELSGLIRR